MSAALFEQYVLNKPYFDRLGLWVAEEDGRTLGFVHAGFGPTDDESRLSTDLGVTAMLLVHPLAHGRGIEKALLDHSEEYLRSRGATVLYAGAIRPLNPFYLGMYGGSELPGVLDSDHQMLEFYRAQGYREVDRVLVFQRDLTEFRAPVDRQQMAIRRRTQVAVVNEPPTRTWWEACTLADFERVEFQLLDGALGKHLAAATLRSIDQAIDHPGVRATGLIDVHVNADSQRQGLATFLLAETLKELHQQGYGLVEAQTMERNVAAIKLYEKLGFTPTDTGRVFRKE